MTRFEVSVVIDAPVQTVFQTATDPDRWPLWQRRFHRIEALTPDGFGVGARYRTVTVAPRGREIVNVSDITGLVPDQQVRLSGRSDVARFDAVWRFAPQGSGARMTIELEIEPLKGGLVVRVLLPWLKGVFRRRMAGDLQALKLLCEGA